MNDVPQHLRKIWNAGEAFATGDQETNWARACADAAREAIEHPDGRLLRTIGLSSAALRPGRNLGERSLGDDSLGQQVLSELAARQRGGR